MGSNRQPGSDGVCTTGSRGLWKLKTRGVKSSGAGASGGGLAAHWPTGEQGTGKLLGCLAWEGRVICVEAPYKP